MKKRFFVYFTLFAVIFACSDDFTDVPAIGALSDQTLQNEQGVNLLLVGAYSALDGIRNNQPGADWAVSGDNWWFDVLADDAHKGSTDGDQADLYLLEIYDWTSGNPYLTVWDGRFAGVNRANAVISLINKIPEGDFTAQLAEARFLRGHFNFELQKMFGNIPFISVENYDATEFNQPNSGPIWDQIEADFQFAVDNLPASQSDVGRPSSWAAKAYLGKVHMFQSEYAAAATLFTDVINNGPYSLLPEFVDNFRLAGDNSVEAIFSIQFTTDGGQSLNGNRGGTLNFPNPGPFGSCCGFYQPTIDLSNAYKTDGTGLPLLDTFNDSDIANDYGVESADPFVPEAGPLDPRLDYTVGRRGIDYNGYGTHIGKDWIRASFADISGPYLPKKNVYYAGEDGNAGTGAWGQQHSGINYHIIRYADVLLMAAEAAVEANDLATALDYVNQVRNRAKNSSYVQNDTGTGPAANYQIEPYASFPSQDVARQAVRFERRLELAMEGHRYFDLTRWGVAESVINEYTQNEARAIPNFGTKVGTFMSNMNILPIPINAIDLSGGALSQNPGY
ncbi:Starch-binding associating with outer membrane [Muriicola jejuensis]|uniref:RagB/SusD family nutrient uptake outer membrane protein n=1 Tax=Muriicola jejuensis TaxID=504488 RepID=A0A6P0UE80_9FLAO|nr:RagB/SusD family nutrient uptake outer membrane protein [Muriicola jejuensis]NER11581.1 RagB/SusD family nutrient uptake outer membrane protein [Muriicola jejuensis]SMP19552.1 Starch-binding associating with outer membrane [Muriicola jejuensis]